MNYSGRALFEAHVRHRGRDPMLYPWSEQTPETKAQYEADAKDFVRINMDSSLTAMGLDVCGTIPDWERNPRTLSSC